MPRQRVRHRWIKALNHGTVVQTLGAGRVLVYWDGINQEMECLEGDLDYW